MPSTNNHILLVNFDFPPNQGIGGRRWAKLAKGLANKGYIVHVIKADPVDGNVLSQWTTDIEHSNIHVYSLPRAYPQSFSHPKPTLVGRIIYRLYKHWLQLTVKGTIYDISIGWNKYFSPRAIQLIKENNIVNVIATGAPWNVLVYANQLSETFDNLNIISDFRDPWLDAQNYGMEGLSPKRKKQEAEKQDYVVSKSAVITTPADCVTREIKKQYASNTHSAKFEVLSHFYDEDDMTETSSLTNNDEIVLLYGGDLYIGVDVQLKRLMDDLRKVKQKDPGLYQKIKVKIYTNAAIPDFLKNRENVTISPSIGKLIFTELRKAHFCLILLPESKRDHITTKCFEFLPFKKPFLVYSAEGDFTKFVRENNLGYCILKEDSDITGILRDGQKIEMNEELIRSKTLTGLTERLISFLK